MNTHFRNMNLGQQHASLNVVQQPQVWFEVCGSVDHATEFYGSNLDSVKFVGNYQQSGGMQNYGNTYNSSWRNHPNFSWGGNSNKNQYKLQGNGLQYQQQGQGNRQSAKQGNMNMEDMLKQIMEDQRG